MQSKLDGAKSKGRRLPAYTEPAATESDDLAATPEWIHWSQTARERSAASRHDRIAIAAYLLSEARGFEAGHDAEDWLAAQSQIDAIDSGSSKT